MKRRDDNNDVRAWLNLAESQPLLYSHPGISLLTGFLFRGIGVKGISKHAKLSWNKFLGQKSGG